MSYNGSLAITISRLKNSNHEYPMDALTALHTRNSVNLLIEPAPNREQLENIIQAGLKACDHGRLRPWKYLIIEGEARNAFGELMASVKGKLDGKPLTEENFEKFKNKAFRAPMIIAVVASITEHPKVPEIEQLLSAGASAQMMMTAAHAQGIGAIWRSGSLMFDEMMHEGLGLNANDKLVGFIYLGTIKAAKPLTTLDSNYFIEFWKG